ncbi:hypothetical protein FRC02_005588 [Tulasnella sp. 418]|nr:hypothetical protein FRC02_005588 [Tulasnella sp. 418]
MNRERGDLQRLDCPSSNLTLRDLAMIQCRRKKAAGSNARFAIKPSRGTDIFYTWKPQCHASVINQFSSIERILCQEHWIVWTGMDLSPVATSSASTWYMNIKGFMYNIG